MQGLVDEMEGSISWCIGRSSSQWRGGGVHLGSISFVFYEIFQIKCFYTMRWRWVSSWSYLNISKYFEYFLIFQVVECTLGGAGRALDQVIAQSTATTSTEPTPLMHTKHHAHHTMHTSLYSHAHPTTIQTVHTATTSTAPVPPMQCNGVHRHLEPSPKTFSIPSQAIFLFGMSVQMWE